MIASSDFSFQARVAVTLVHFLWQGLLIYGLWRIGLAAMARSRPQARYWFSLLAIFALAICPLATMACLPTSARTSLESLHPERLRPVESARPLDDAHSSTNAWCYYILAAWATGVIMLSLKLLAGYVGVCGLRRGLQPIELTRLPGASRLASLLRLDLGSRLFTSDRVAEAVVVGFYRPLILVPTAWMAEMPIDLLEAVIAHEMAHIRRWDLWVNLMQRFLETILFYHPVVWVISRRIRVERELCCDELAVATTGERLIYVDALGWVASRSIATSRPMLTAAILGDRKMRLLTRVRNVLQMDARSERGTWWVVATLALILPLSAWVVAGALKSASEKRDKERTEKDGDRADDGESNEETGN